MNFARPTATFLLAVAATAAAMLALGPTAARADADDQPPEAAEAQARALVNGLRFQQGTVKMHGDLATLQVPDTMQFLGGHDAATVVYKLWGNPPGEDPLGMLVPKDCDLLGNCWAVIITFQEDGYVKDDEAAKINYDKLLTDMQKQTRAANEERQKEGYPRSSWSAGPPLRATITTPTSSIGRRSSGSTPTAKARPWTVLTTTSACSAAAAS